MKQNVCELSDQDFIAVLPKEANAISILSVSIVPFSLFLNGSIALNIALRWRLRVIKSAFTLNVCVIDLLVSLMGRLPFSISNLVPSRIYCRMGMMVGHTTISLSLFALFFLTIERYIAIFFPYKYPHFLTKRKVGSMLLLTWLVPWALGIMIYIPGIPGKPLVFVAAVLNIAVITSLVIMHCHTIYTLVKINRETDVAAARFKANVDRRCLIRKSKGVRYLSGAMVVLFACYLPLSLMALLKKNPRDTHWMRINFIAVTLAALPDIMNPICILYSSPEIRKLVLKLPWT